MQYARAKVMLAVAYLPSPNRTTSLLTPGGRRHAQCTHT